jgi:hypothetical protein
MKRIKASISFAVNKYAYVLKCYFQVFLIVGTMTGLGYKSIKYVTETMLDIVE